MKLPLEMCLSVQSDVKPCIFYNTWIWIITRVLAKLTEHDYCFGAMTSETLLYSFITMHSVCSLKKILSRCFE